MNLDLFVTLQATYLGRVSREGLLFRPSVSYLVSKGQCYKVAYVLCYNTVL